MMRAEHATLVSTGFDQDLGGWDVSGVINMHDMFVNSNPAALLSDCSKASIGSSWGGSAALTTAGYGS